MISALIHDQHWQIEQFHRAIKQVCHIEHFQVRNERPVRNHIFSSILSFVYLQKMQIAQEFTNIYQHQLVSCLEKWLVPSLRFLQRQR